MDQPFETVNLSRYQFDLLWQVTFEPGINQKTCAERMNVTKGNITQHLDKLETLGLIQRNKVGRESSLQLSQKGEKFVSEFMPIHDARVKEILSVLSPEEVNQLQSILRKLDRSIG
jgi:DNA-binding MarR family transcriptional regulator